jgi:hypothetical protein
MGEQNTYEDSAITVHLCVAWGSICRCYYALGIMGFTTDCGPTPESGRGQRGAKVSFDNGAQRRMAQILEFSSLY